MYPLANVSRHEKSVKLTTFVFHRCNRIHNGDDDGTEGIQWSKRKKIVQRNRLCRGKNLAQTTHAAVIFLGWLNIQFSCFEGVGFFIDRTSLQWLIRTDCFISIKENECWITFCSNWNGFLFHRISALFSNCKINLNKNWIPLVFSFRKMQSLSEVCRVRIECTMAKQRKKFYISLLHILRIVCVYWAQVQPTQPTCRNVKCLPYVSGLPTTHCANNVNIEEGFCFACFWNLKHKLWNSIPFDFFLFNSEMEVIWRKTQIFNDHLDEMFRMQIIKLRYWIFMLFKPFDVVLVHSTQNPTKVTLQLI